MKRILGSTIIEPFCTFAGKSAASETNAPPERIAEHCDGKLIVRNQSALFMQATFSVKGRETKLILSADVDHATIDDIVRVTRFHNNEVRLEWDINNIPHHCSYTSLAAEKGKDETEPSDRLKWLYEQQARANAIAVSTSDPIQQRRAGGPSKC